VKRKLSQLLSGFTEIDFNRFIRKNFTLSLTRLISPEKFHQGKLGKTLEIYSTFAEVLNFHDLLMSVVDRD
jgi:hypothetical protein